MKLDETLWRHSAWECADYFFDGSYPRLRWMMSLSDLEIQKGYLETILENQKLGIKDAHFANDAVFYRHEMYRRLKEGLVSFDERSIEERALEWAAARYLGANRKKVMKVGRTLAREAVDEFFRDFSGTKRGRLIDAFRGKIATKVRNTAGKKEIDPPLAPTVHP